MVADLGGSGRPPLMPTVTILANLPIIPLANPIGHLDIARIGGQLVIDEEHPPLLGRLFAGGFDREAAGYVDGHGLGHIDVQAGLGGGGRVFGQEAGGHDQGHRLDAAFDHSLVAREAGEPPPLVHAPLVAQGVGHLREVVGDGVQLIAAMLEEKRERSSFPRPPQPTSPSLILRFGASGFFSGAGAAFSAAKVVAAPSSGAAAAALDRAAQELPARKARLPFIQWHEIFAAHGFLLHCRVESCGAAVSAAPQTIRASP